MATLVKTTVFNTETSAPSGTQNRYSYTLDTASGNDRLVVVVPGRIRNSVTTVTAAAFDSTAGTVWNQLGVDGGNAISTAVCYFLESDLPATAGTYDIDITWAATDISGGPAIIYEFTDASQTTPLEDFGSNTQQDQTEGGTIAATLSNSAGKFGVSYLAVAELSIGTPNNTIPAGMTNAGDAKTFHIDVSSAYINSVASASESYEWTYDFGTSLELDSIVTGTFAVNSNAALPITVNANTAASNSQAPNPTVNIPTAGAPTISNVTDLIAESTVTVTVDAYQAGASIELNGSAQTTTEATATTLTCEMPRGGFGGIGATVAVTVTDSNGTSNTVNKTYLAPTGFTSVTLTSIGSGSLAEAAGASVGDVIVYELLDSAGNAYSIDVAGYSTFDVSSPAGSTADFYIQDASDGYSAPALPNSTDTKAASVDISAQTATSSSQAPNPTVEVPTLGAIEVNAQTAISTSIAESPSIVIPISVAAQTATSKSGAPNSFIFIPGGGSGVDGGNFIGIGIGVAV